MSLRLRPVRLADEEACRRAHDAVAAADDFRFLLAGDDEPWPAIVERLERNRCGVDLPDGIVASAFLLATVGPVLIGRASIRLSLNDYLARAGGHIGYVVVPDHRRRGHATEILRQSLIVARSHGVDEVLVTCAVDNAASARVIERNGGVFESFVDDEREQVRKRRYWIR